MLHKILNSLLKKKLYLFITVFVVLIIGISLGSAILTKTLNIIGRTKIENSWVIYFDDVVLNNDSVKNDDTSNDAKIVDFEKQNIEFSANLSSITDFYEFDVYTVNDGNIDAMIDSIELTGLTGNEEYITYDVRYDDGYVQSSDTYYSNKYSYSNDELKPCDPLYGRTRRKIKVRVSLKKELEDDEPINLHLGFKINYVQFEPDCNLRHTLTIEPNGGTYNGSRNNAKIKMLNGDSELIKVPRKGDHGFLGWEVITPSSGTYTFDPTQTTEQQFTMGDEDVTIRAKWNDSGDFVARIENTYYTTIQSAFDDVDTGWTDNTVHLLKSTTESPTNNANAAFKFDLEGYTVTGNITNSSNSNITLVNGHVVSNSVIENDANITSETTISNHGQAITNYGTLTLGVNDGTVDIQNSISIVGNRYGIINYRNSTFNFYDGYIDAIVGTDNKVEPYYMFDKRQGANTPTDYSVIIEHLETGQRAYVVRDPSRAVAKTKLNGDNTLRFYYELQDAINYVIDNKEDVLNEQIDYNIYAIRDFDVGDDVIIPDGEDITLDVSKYDISFGSNLTNLGTFRIINESDNRDESSKSKIMFSVPLDNQGILYINNTNFDVVNDSNTINNKGILYVDNSLIHSINGYSIYNDNCIRDDECKVGNNTVRINLTSTAKIDSDNQYGIGNVSNDLTLNNGKVYGLYNEGTATIDDDIEFILEQKVPVPSSGDKYINAIYNANHGTINMDGGTIESDIDTYIIQNYGEFYLKDGTINAVTGFKQYENYRGTGKLYVTGGEITTEKKSIQSGYVYMDDIIDSNGDVVSSGTIRSTNNNTIDSYLTMNGGTIISDTSSAVYTSSDIVINNGYIKGKENGIFLSTSASGELEFNGGTIESDDIGIKSGRQIIIRNNVFKKKLDEQTGELIDTDELVPTLVKAKNIGVYSNGNGYNKLTIEGGEIIAHDEGNSESTSIGVYSVKESLITGGKIVGDLYGVQSLGTLTLGVDDYDSNDKALINKQSPEIIGGQYGLYIQGNETNFYDGILKGRVDGYYGNITDNPLGSIDCQGTDTINGELYQTDYVDNYIDWLQVGNTTYNNINAASKAIGENGTITVINDASVAFRQSFVNFEDGEENNRYKNITFDLNGHTITSTQSIENNVNLTIVDSSISEQNPYGLGTYIPVNNTGIINEKELIINGGNYISSVSSPIQNNSNMTVNNANFDVDLAAIENGNAAHQHTILTISNINIKSKKNGINNIGSITMNGGLIDADEYGIYNNTDVGSGVTLTHGKIFGKKGGIYLRSGSTTVEGDGIVESTNGNAIYTYYGSINIKDTANIKSTNTIAILGHHNINIDNGTISGTIGVQNEYWSSGNIRFCETVTINDGNIIGTQTSGVNSTCGDLKIFGGVIKGETNGVTTLAKTQIGRNDGSISTSSPELIGKVYGLDTSYFSMFYDGILKGITAAHNGLISEIPDGTMIKDDIDIIDDVRYKTQYLTDYGNWLRVGNQVFNSINAAAQAINGSGTMEVIANPYINFPQSIPEGKDITFDLNGHNLIMTLPIEVNGKLTITDSTVTGDNLGGGITNLRDHVIDNKGELIINKGIYSTMASDKNTIYNNSISTFTLNNGKLNTNGDYAVNNDGTFTMNGGTIKTHGGVYNNGTFTMNDGYIEGTEKHALYIVSDATINGGTIKRTVLSSSSSIDSAIYVLNNTLTINGGNIVSEVGNSSIYVTCIGSSRNKPKLVVNNGSIFGNKYGIKIYDWGGRTDSVKINGGNIKGDETAIYNSQGGLIALGGLIEGELYGIYSNDNITIGANDYDSNNKAIISQVSPDIRGKSYAIYNESNKTFNFYDGILKGNVNGDTDAYYGDITNIPTNAELLYGEEETYKTTLVLTEQRIIAQNINTNKYYINLQEAFDEAGQDETIKLTFDQDHINDPKNISLFYELTNNNENAFTLNMNGFKIMTNKQIKNNGSLKIINVDNNNQPLNNKAIIQTRADVVLLTNEEDLEIDNVIIRNLKPSRYINSSNDTRKYVLINKGNIKINKCVISNDEHGFDNYGLYEITESEISSSGTTLTNENRTGECTIDDSIVNGRISKSRDGSVIIRDSILDLESGLYIAGGQVKIYGSNINGEYTTKINNGYIQVYGELLLEGVEINSVSCNAFSDVYSLKNYNRIDINNSKINVIKSFTSYSYANAIISNEGTLNVSNTTMTIDSETAQNNINAIDYYGIITKSGDVSFLNTNINVVGSRSGYGIRITGDSEVNFTSGKINVDKAKDGYGVSVESGKFVFGEPDDDSNGNNVISSANSNPMIYVSASNTSIGVNRTNGVFNFHDGVVWSSKQAVPYVSKTPKYHEVTTYVDKPTGFKYAVLEDTRNDYQGTAVARINKIYYPTLQDAVNDSNVGDEIVLLQSVTEDINVNRNKDISLNLNGKDLTTTITNNGSLRAFGGNLQNINKTVVINNGTFIMGIDDGNVFTTNIKVANEATAIINNGTVEMYDGYIEGNTAISGDINVIAQNSRIYTVQENNKEIKYLQSLNEEDIINGRTDLMLTIDPNGGTYESSTNNKIVYLKYNNTYTLSAPVKDDATFNGWDITIPEVLNGNIITMGTSDVIVTARWRPNANVVAEVEKKYYTSLSAALNAAVDGDTIYLVNNTTENITNTKNVTIDLSSYKVTGEFINNGELVLINGTIENTNGIGLTNNGKLVLGLNDDVINDTSVKIIGSTTGLKQNGTFNFYDGYIEGQLALDGTISVQPKDYYLLITNMPNNIQRVSLSETTTSAIAAIYNNNDILYYNNLSSAIASAQTLNKEITMLKDYTSTEQLSVSNGTNVTINLNSYNVILNRKLTNNGTLKLYDGSDNGELLSIRETIENNGSLNIDNVDITQLTTNNVILNNGSLSLTDTKLTATSGYAVYDNGTLTINKGTELISNSYALYNNQNIDLSITTGKISSINNMKSLIIGGNTIIDNTSTTIPAINMNASSSLVINNGTINSNYMGVVFSSSEASVTMNGGELVALSDGINCSKQNPGASITINGGTIESINEDGIYGNTRKTSNIITVTGGTITGFKRGIYTTETLNMTGGTVISKSTDIDKYALSCESSSICNIDGDVHFIAETASGIYSYNNLTIEGATVTANSYNGYGLRVYDEATIGENTTINSTGAMSIGIYFSDGDFVIDGATINSENIGISNNYTAKTTLKSGSIIAKLYGAYQPNANSVINVGDSSDTLSTTDPYISGGLYGIYSTAGVINYYNGRLRGATEGYSGTIKTIREKKEIKTEHENVDVSGTLTYSTSSVSSIATSQYAKQDDGAAKITYIGESTETCPTGKVFNYEYTGTEVIFTTPCAGKYKLEVWGAQGGSYNTSDKQGGYGGYSTGEINLSLNEKLYINVGGRGTITSSDANSISLGGYNGGGNSMNDITNGEYSGSGGGATSIATSSGELYTLENNRNNILIVAGGGGGYYYGKNSNYNTTKVGHGGGYIGGTSIWNKNSSSGGSQNDGYSFGTASLENQNNTPGAGGGYYGGYSDKYRAGGGSGYIGNSRLDNASMYGYSTEVTVSGYTINYLIEKGDFLQVGSDTYNSIDDAIEAISSTGTITVIQSAEVNESSTIPSGKNITLNLNDNDLTFTETITNNGTLNITDSSNNKHTIENNISDVLVNNGTLSLNGIKINSTKKIIEIASSNTTTSISNCEITTSDIVINDSNTNNCLNNYTISNSKLTSTNNNILYIYSKENNNNDLQISDSELYDNSGSIINLKYIDGEISNTKINDSNNSSITLERANIDITNGSYFKLGANGITVSYSDVNVIDSKISVDGNNSKAITHRSGNLNLSGNSKITATGNNSVGILLNNNAVEFTMDGGIITAGSIGIDVSSSSSKIVNINSGTVTGGLYGVRLNHNDATINIGNANSTFSIENPLVEGGDTGVNIINGTFNFYNGLLKGKQNSYTGEINSVRTGKEIYNYIEFDTSGDLPVEYSLTILKEKDGYLKVGDNTYNNFAAAIDALGPTESGTITVISDSIIQDAVTIDGNDIVLDLNGHKLTLFNPIINEANLTLTDSGTNGTIKSNNSVFTNSGILTINNGKIEAKQYGIYTNTASHTININGGSIISDNYGIYYEGDNAYSNVLNITNGTITSNDSYAIYNNVSTSSNRNQLNITGGNITGATHGVYLQQMDSDISGGTISTTSTNTSNYSVYMSSGTVYLKNGSTINSQNASGVYLSSGNLYLQGVVINTYSDGAYGVNANSGNIYSSNNTIINTRGLSTGIYNRCTFNITDITINSDNIGLYNLYNTVNFNSGTISGNTYGLYTTGGTVNIGKSSDTLSTDDPIIVGGSYGIYRDSGTINYYNGKIKGIVDTTNTEYNNIRTNHYPKIEVIDNYYVSTLAPLIDVVRNKDTDTTYTKLSTALNAVNTGEELELISDVYNYDTLTLAAGKTVTIDLKGHNVYDSKGITNNGVLTITNSSNNSSKWSSNIASYSITNNNELVINNISIESKGSAIYSNKSTTTRVTMTNSTILNSATGININGLYTIENSEINSTTYGIYDSRATNVDQNIINNTKIKSTGTAVYVYNKGNLSISNSNKLIEGYINVNNADSILYITNANIKNSIVNNKGSLTIKNCLVEYITSGNSSDNIITNNGTMTLEDNTLNVVFNGTSTSAYTDKIIYNNSTLTSRNNTYEIKHEIEEKYRTLFAMHNIKILTSNSDTFKVSGAKTAFSIYNDNSSSTCDLTNASLITSNSTNSYGIYTNGGILSLKSGSINSTGGTSYGIYVNAGTLNIGEIDTSGNSVDVDNPLIQSIGSTSGTGLYKRSGTINYYDGKIIGSTSPLQNNLQFSQVQPNFSVSTLYDSETGYNYCILEHN